MNTRKCYYLKRLEPHDDQNIIIPFKKNEVLIGRSIEATHTIPNTLISRRHAVFKCSGEKWKVTNLSLNGVFVNGNLVPKEEERSLDIGDTVQLGQPANFVYRFGVKEIIQRSQSSSEPSNIKRIKSEGSRGACSTTLHEEHAILEQQLKDSDALQVRLRQERDQLKLSLQQQKEDLQKQYEAERLQLGQMYSAGSFAQQQENEALKQRLETQILELQKRLEDERTAIEERVRKEEEQRNHILQEKEKILHRLGEEKKRLEQQLQEERETLQQRLQATENRQEELRQEVEAKNSVIRAKEEEHQRAVQEQQQLQEELEEQRRSLLAELDKVKLQLVEKDLSHSALDFELKSKKDELHQKLASLKDGVEARVTAEVEKSTARVREEALKELQQVQRDKDVLEGKLQQAKAEDQQQLSNLQEALQTLEAQKMFLEQELASTTVASEHARKEVVESVSDVLENEFQCPICNDLFITAVMLNCSHTFCRYCIDQWKKNKRDCPTCRSPITSETRSIVVDNFIEKIVPTLSDEMKKRRTDIVNERKAEMQAAEAAAAAAAAAAEAARGGRRGRGRNRGRGRYGARQTQARQRRNNQPQRPPPEPQPQAASEPQYLGTVTHRANPQVNNGTEVPDQITVSSESEPETSDTSMNSDSSSVSGDEFAYYGGYGRCYYCGRRGHWSNGCLDRGLF